MLDASDGKRLGGFAAGHFGLSLVCFMAMMSGLTLWDLWLVWPYLAGLVVLLLYFPVGALLGAVAPWARVSTPGELRRSLALQTSVAWLWGGLVLLALSSPNALSALVWLISPTFVLAFPSSYFFLCMVTMISSDAVLPGGVGAICVMLLAGLLPPLFYNLGNFCVSRRKAAAGAKGPEAE